MCCASKKSIFGGMGSVNGLGQQLVIDFIKLIYEDLGMGHKHFLIKFFIYFIHNYSLDYNYNWVFCKKGQKRPFGGGVRKWPFWAILSFSGGKICNFEISWLKVCEDSRLICRKIHLLKGPHGQIFPVFDPFSGFSGPGHKSHFYLCVFQNYTP